MLKKSKPGKLHAGIRTLSTLILMLLVFVSLSFQNTGKEIRGFVVNKYGKHLSGVQISVSGQKNKVNSDAMGHFVIRNVQETATITISAEDYESQTVSPVFTSEMVIRLQPDVSQEELRKRSAEFFPAPGSRPLIVINGVAEEKLSMADIDPANHVASLKIYTGNDAVTRFGEKAKNGAVEITTEPGTASEKSKIGPPADSPEFKEKTLVLIDGKVYTGDIKDIPRNTVESMSVRNYSSDYDKYGFKGKEKVIEFKTR